MNELDILKILEEQELLTTVQYQENYKDIKNFSKTIFSKLKSASIKLVQTSLQFEYLIKGINSIKIKGNYLEQKKKEEINSKLNIITALLCEALCVLEEVIKEIK